MLLICKGLLSRRSGVRIPLATPHLIIKTPFPEFFIFILFPYMSKSYKLISSVFFYSDNALINKGRYDGRSGGLLADMI